MLSAKPLTLRKLARKFARKLAHKLACNVARNFAFLCPDSGFHCIARLVVPLSLFAVLSTGHAQPSGKNPNPEVIMGQARSLPRSAPRTQAKAETETGSFFPNALAPLPAPSYPRKTKRARKHRLDLDHDGYISRSEFELEHHARFNAFRSADRNLDGKLDAEELRQFRKLTQGRGRGG